MAYDYYIGIDPGKSGGIAIMDSSGIVEIFKTPLSPIDFFHKFEPYADKSIYCITEKVHSMPQNGGKANYTFGYINGVLHTILMVCQIPFDLRTPQMWMKYYALKKGKSESNTQWKNRLKVKAQQLFPKEKVTLWNADALLIANYCREEYR